MMNGNDWGGSMMGGGWAMMIGGLLCLAIIGAIVWLVLWVMKNQRRPPEASLSQQQSPSERHGQSPHPVPKTYQEGGKQYQYPTSVQDPSSEERPESEQMMVAPTRDLL